MANVVLTVNGKEFAGWKSARITRGIECVAGGFTLQVSDRWANQAKAWPIVEGDRCTLQVEGVTVITGYVDRKRMSYGANEHSLEVSGRDRTGDLVDCSAVLKSWEFNDVPLLSLAQEICGPFGITVSLSSAFSHSLTISAKTGHATGLSGAGGGGKTGGTAVPKAPRKFSIDPGESAFEVIDRACKMAGVIPVSDGKGGLLLTRAGTARGSTALIEGQNILQASAEFDSSKRYRTYKVFAQIQGTDENSGPSAASIQGEATDPSVARAARVLVIRPEASATPESAKIRAQWEAKVRAARSAGVTVTVQGWTQVGGVLWPVNSIVRLTSPMLGLDRNLLITQTDMSLDDSGGTTTQLTLKRADAFLPEPLVGDSGLWPELRNGA